MSSPYIGEIRLVGFNFAPVDWAFCDGSLIAISQNETLFNLIGTTYGGNGQTTFALPDLRGRVPIHQGSNGQASFVIGQLSGSETVTLTTNQIPAHSHALAAQSANGSVSSPAGNVPAASTLDQFSTTAPATTMASVLNQSGGSQPHDNMSPFLVANYVIALYGIYPSQG